MRRSTLISQIILIFCIFEEQKAFPTTTPPVPPTTLGPPTTTPECTEGESKEENCRGYTCDNGRWLSYGIFQSEYCCKMQSDRNMMCEGLFPDLYTTTTTEPPTTTIPPTTSGPPTTTPECIDGQTKEQACFSFGCNNGHWLKFEFVKSEHCCKTHPNPHPVCYLMFPEMGPGPSWLG